MIEITPPPAPPTPAGGFVLPTHSPEGQPLDAKAQFNLMNQNPQWNADAQTPGTVAHAQLQDMNARMAAASEAGVDAFEAPAASPDAYQLPFDASEPGVAELAMSARTWLHEAGFGAQTGSSLAQAVDELGRKALNWTEEDFARHERDGKKSLEAVYGAELPAKVELVADMLDRIEAKHPELGEFFEAAPFVLRDAMVVHFLIQAAEAQAARR